MSNTYYIILQCGGITYLQIVEIPSPRVPPTCKSLGSLEVPEEVESIWQLLVQST